MLNQKLTGQQASGDSKTYIEDVFSTYLYTGNGETQTINNGIALNGDEVNGILYSTPGTYSWVCPAGITSVSVVCVGGGGAGALGQGPYGAGAGGGGGGTGYINNFSVTPGNVYPVVVGAGGAIGNGSFPNGGAGGASSFANTLYAYGGSGGTASTASTGGTGGNGGSYSGGTGGGAGGKGGNTNQASIYGAGGGGAGGYSGVGGSGGTSATAGGSGTGGGAGGGAGQSSYNRRSGGSGGGLGLYGSGANGAGGTTPGGGGGGGSGGSSGVASSADYLASTAGSFGGGGGGGSTGYNAATSAGASGAVRILWSGTTRQFPSTNVNKQLSSDVGGMVWIKDRTSVSSNVVYDTDRGATKHLITSSTAAQATLASGLNAFNSNGFSVGIYANVNASPDNYASWTFRKAPKFFDVVTYTGNGVARTISHSLGSVPGMAIVKCTSTTGNWAVYHNGQTSASYYTKLNLTDAQASDTTVWNGTAPTSSVFSVGTSALTNTNGATYVAYLFAHDTTTDGLIQCGSFTTDGSGNATVNLGWEPQYLMYKASSGTGSWLVVDNMRGFAMNNAEFLYPNTTNAAISVSSPVVTPSSTGFTFTGADASTTLIYMAIRRGPMRTPTDGTTVFEPVSYTGNGTYPRKIGSLSKVDLIVSDSRQSNGWPGFFDRLRGSGVGLFSNDTGAEISAPYFSLAESSGISVIATRNGSSIPWVNWNFQRAPGFFDVVCYTGTGGSRVLNHNLGVVPELVIWKSRSSSGVWIVQAAPLGWTAARLFLNTNGAVSAFANFTSPTSTTITCDNNTNASGASLVMYLFAACPGVSKVGSYTGNGTSQTINCGFANGARFVMIKRTDSTGDWYVWDTARGIVAANDPHLSLNTTAAEVTSDDTIDPESTGFIVNQVAATNVNVSGGSYIYLAIA